MEHYSLDLPVSEMHVSMVHQVSSNPESHHFTASMSVPGNAVLSTLMTENNNLGHNEFSGGSVWPNQIHMLDQSGTVNAKMRNNITDERTPLSVKRKAEVGPLSNNSHNKKPENMGENNSSVSSAPQRKTVPVQPKSFFPGMPAQNSSNKKMLRNDSISGKSGLQKGPSAKRPAAQIEPASKARPESSEATRSKMRESLSAALALAVQKQNSVSTTQNNQSEAAITHQTMDSQALDNNIDMRSHIPVSGSEILEGSDALNNTNESQALHCALPPSERSQDNGQGFQGFQYASILPDEDVSFGGNFFGKDDLLQGNGLSWAFDFDPQIGIAKEAQPAKKPEPIKDEPQAQGEKVSVLAPENLAFEIEAELFKLFGDVNKKYREKGRSLLFNLKDRNNPDLRERVISGEIVPENLCSMSAEELASKELSEWRMAKAEELGKMVVLPDTQVDIRRLVKKTHKGEYQVEVEYDDGIAAEVSSGTSVLTQMQPPPPQKDPGPHSPSEVGVRDKGEDEYFCGSLIIPTDGTDLMQGMMMVDELKDAEFLPPIVSLDEFMESLNNEPPFENLSGDAVQKTTMPLGESPKLGREFRASSQASVSPRDALLTKICAFKKHAGTLKLNESPMELKSCPIVAPKVEYTWDGMLQLNISSSVTVGGLFQSGEKTSTKVWPASLEIKGRVRLDAFEKFLQELPNSRTRAVMVLHYVLKDTLSETQRANLSEAVDSYVADERLGYAEPASGVELYLCPPTSRIFDILNKLNLKENMGTIENGLIGVVVWRRSHINKTISPSPNSYKHTLNKQQFPKTLDRTPQLIINNNNNPKNDEDEDEDEDEDDDDDDDIPPGFGPIALKDSDDLPEYNFSGDLRAKPKNMNMALTMRQQVLPGAVDQARELIKKYGQSGTESRVNNNNNNMKIGNEPWTDDGDDDIPEWQPQLPPSRYVAPQLASNNQPAMMQLPEGFGFGHPIGIGKWVDPPGLARGPRWTGGRTK